MPKLSFFAKMWVCRAILRHNLTICAFLCFTTDINLEHPVPRSDKHKQTKIFWNIPTFQCDPYKLNFHALSDKYGFVQNENDRFRGKYITILYDPGSFPAILKNGSQTIIRNGGVPQEGNLTKHLLTFEDVLYKLIPEKSFSGIGIIDFESWRPIFRQNFGKLGGIETLSIAIEKEKHPSWNKSQLKQEATRRFEDAARKFMATTLMIAKKGRPKATWGYYAYPYCFNMSPNSMRQECPRQVMAENDRLKWLFQLTENFYPSIYLGNSSHTAIEKVQMVEGRIEESLRIIKQLNVRKSIMLYFWYKYQDTNKFITKKDLVSVITAISKFHIDGLVLWGSSNDVNSGEKCLELYQYIDDILGPILVQNL